MLSPRLLLPLAALTSAVATGQVCPNEDFLSPNHTLSSGANLTFAAISILDPLALTVAEPRDFFFVDVPANQAGTIGIFFSDAQADLDLVLYDATMSEIDASESTTDNETVNFSTGAAPERFYIEALNYSAIVLGGSCGDYVLELGSQPTSSCDADDIYEGTDDCDTTLGLQGTFPQNTPIDLILKPGDPDWFDVRLQPQETLNLTINFSHATADLDLRARELTAAGCGTTLASSAGVTDSESISVFNSTGNFQDVAIEAYWFSTSSGATCTDYTLSYEIIPGSDPCTPDDVFESNDNACEAAPLFVGVFPNLQVGDGDPDFYSFEVPGGLIGVFAIDFDHSQGDVDLFVYTGGDCLTLTLVGASTSISDYEEVTLDRSGLPAETMYVEVRYVNSNGGCNDYTMTIGERRPGLIGEQTCFGEVNSAGTSSEVLGLGSASVSDNDLRLDCIGLPPQTFGFFINSRQAGFIPNPAGSSGNLCIQGSIGRYVGPGEIQNTGSGTTVSLVLDLAAMPTPTGFVAAAPGETWFFQYWHRDSSPTGPTSNFSGAQRVRFE
ncbi:MAG: PPC domain-containing protein [Planctomycetota bacterium]